MSWKNRFFRKKSVEHDRPYWFFYFLFSFNLIHGFQPAPNVEVWLGHFSRTGRHEATRPFIFQIAAISPMEFHILDTSHYPFSFFAYWPAWSHKTFYISYCCYFTNGISHIRHFTLFLLIFRVLAGMKPQDLLYFKLPLFHQWNFTY